MKKEKETLTHYRTRIGADIIERMDKENDLPMPNKKRLCIVMQEYFKRKGFYTGLLDDGYNWKAGKMYWFKKLDEIKSLLYYERNKCFDFVRLEGVENIGKGNWKFVAKKEYETILTLTYNGNRTRMMTLEEKIDIGKEKFHITGITAPPVPEKISHSNKNGFFCIEEDAGSDKRKR